MTTDIKDKQQDNSPEIVKSEVKAADKSEVKAIKHYYENGHFVVSNQGGAGQGFSNLLKRIFG